MSKKIQGKIALYALFISFFVIPVSFALSQGEDITDVEVYYYSDEDLSIPLNVYGDDQAIRGKGTVYLKFVTQAEFTLEHFSIRGQNKLYLDQNNVSLISSLEDRKTYKGQWVLAEEGIFDEVTVTLNEDNYVPKVGKNIYIDTKPPTLKSIRVVNNTKIEIFFDEFWLDGESVKDATYYSINPQLTIDDILVGGSFARVFTSPQTDNINYTITLDKSGIIKDAAGNQFTADENSLSFMGTEVTTEDPHGYYGKSTSLCAVCHSTHQSQGQTILKQDQATVCFLCHDSAGQSKYDVNGQFESKHLNFGYVEDEEGEFVLDEQGNKVFKNYNDRLVCSDCHDVHAKRTEERSKLLRSYKYVEGEEVKQLNKNDFCWSCHGDINNRNLKVKRLFPEIAELFPNNEDIESKFSFYGHKDIYKNPNASPANNYENDCLYCHNGHSSIITDYGGENFSLCFNCHNAENENKPTNPIPNIQKYYDGSIGEGHVIRNSSYGFKDDQGELLPVGWKIPCSDCHSPHGNSYQNEMILNDDLSERMGGMIGLWTTEVKQRAACFACHKPSDEEGSNGRNYRGGVIPKLRDLDSVEGYVYQHANNLENENKPLNPMNCLECHGGSAHNVIKKP